MSTLTDKQYLVLWKEFKDNIQKSTPVDLNETAAEKTKRIQRLESDPEQWYKYYFPNYCKYEPAKFHRDTTDLIIRNSEFFIMRIWARELAKTARTMMDVLFLSLTGKKRNWLLISATETLAQRLLLPIKSQLEANNRLINDYGIQESGLWSAGEFVTRDGVAFLAVGAGQSPRGSRKDEVRPDGIIFDDIDTDEEVRNSERIDIKVNWCMEAVIGTRSISEDLLVIVCGNIIGKKTTITELRKYADHVSLVNIRDKHGKSTWPSKNTEEKIDRVLSKISYASGQKEYYNNPIVQGKTFKTMHFGKCPPINKCSQVVVYADPAPSNKDKSGSTKAVVIVGYFNFTFYVYRVWLDQMNTAKFVDALFAADDYLNRNRVDVKRIWIENNSLQDPFWQQVIKPAIKTQSLACNRHLSVMPDNRKKPEKFFRIEGTLEPEHRNGNLIFNKDEETSLGMAAFKDQWLAVDPDAKTMDGPDALEGAVHKLKNRQVEPETPIISGPTFSRRY
jgi:hypothetical protein